MTVTATADRRRAEACAGEHHPLGLGRRLRVRAGPRRCGVRIADDSLPVVTLAPAAVEVPEGGGSVTVTASLDVASSRTVTVDYATADGTATAGEDYTATAGTLTFAPRAQSASFSVPVVADARDEEDQTFTVALETPTEAALGEAVASVVTITDDDTAPTVGLPAGPLTVDEGAGEVAVAVSLVGGQRPAGDRRLQDHRRAPRRAPAAWWRRSSTTTRRRSAR